MSKRLDDYFAGLLADPEINEQTEIIVKALSYIALVLEETAAGQSDLLNAVRDIEVNRD